MTGQVEIFILMAGLGSRFRQEEFNTPKPLIKFRDQPLFAWALKSVKDFLPHANLHLVICDEDHIREKTELELTRLSNFNFHTVHIISLPKRTNGPLETALEAVRQTAAHDRDNPVIFCDCDLYLESSEWQKAITKLHKGLSSADAFLITFDSDGEKHSYVKTDSAGRAVEVAEKKVISNNAIAGFYVFKSAKMFLQAGNKILMTPAPSNEHFISQVYNELIGSGKTVEIFKTEKLLLLGTPEDVAAAEKSTLI